MMKKYRRHVTKVSSGTTFAPHVRFSVAVESVEKCGYPHDATCDLLDQGSKHTQPHTRKSPERKLIVRISATLEAKFPMTAGHEGEERGMQSMVYEARRSTKREKGSNLQFRAYQAENHADHAFACARHSS